MAAHDKNTNFREFRKVTEQTTAKAAGAKAITISHRQNNKLWG